mmetsp:Transcript_64601/g.148551  ORF Transcript_64601/g.148551 Transcript_64601/m.148551 type:complete len:100 (-) Transcript_64601:13-312(-)
MMFSISKLFLVLATVVAGEMSAAEEEALVLLSQGFSFGTRGGDGMAGQEPFLQVGYADTSLLDLEEPPPVRRTRRQPCQPVLAPPSAEDIATRISMSEL